MKTQIAIKWAVLVAALVSVVSPGAQAAPAQSPADALIARAEQALQSASSFQADFEEIDTYPSKYKDLAQRGDITLARPGQLRIDIRRFRRVSAVDPWAASGNDTVSNSDGATYTYAFLHLHSALVRREPSTQAPLASALRLLPPVAAFFEPAGNTKLPGQSGAATLESEQTWERALYQVVQYPVEARGGESTAHAYIGKDGLIHRLVYTSQTPNGEAVREWDLRHIVLNGPVAKSAFAYTPPANAAVEKPGQHYDLLAAGTPAPDFTVYDKAGRPVKLSDYRGKTVVLDFWATWCWPCNQSLPHVESVAEANKGNSVAVLAVAIWDSKTGFDLWTARHHFADINFAIDPKPDGQDVASTLYHVGTTPTAYVIGPDGKIVRAIAGFTGPTGELESAIQSASPVKSARAAQ